MKKLLVGFIILIGTVVRPQSAAGDFRGFSWGDSFEKVRSQEKAHYVTKKGESEVEYKDILGGADIRILYVFNDDKKLISGIYIFAKTFKNPEIYVHNYNEFSKLLSEKYGKPTNEKETWSSNVPIHDIANLGQAVLDGDVNLYTVWNTERSVIKITLISIDGRPSMQIHYTTRTLDELENKEDLRAALSKL
jgi:hypothetical protein